MRSVILRRVALLPILLLGVALITFVMSQLVPGDPARVIAGQMATEEDVERIREDLRLDRPVVEQFGSYIGRLSTGDLGQSLRARRSVAAELADRVPATIELTLAALVPAVPIGFGLGVLSAVRRNKGVDYGVTLGTILLVSLPLFWVGLLLAWLFGVVLGWLPFSGRLPAFSTLEERTGFVLLDATLAGDGRAFVDGLRHLALPALTLATVPIALIARMTRSAFVEVLSQDYMRTADAYGLPPRLQLRRYAARNAMPPILTLVGVLVPALLSGAVLTETVFGWPGIGTLMLASIEARDYAVITSVTLVIAVLYIVSSLVVDLVVAAIDPRVREA